MDIDRQIQLLISDAPQDGQTPRAIAAIAPVLKLLASRLRHLEYYVLQVDRQIILTTLSNRARPEIQKNVIYAFATLQDAITFQSPPDPQLKALTLPVTHILFQMFGTDKLDSTIFFDTPGNLVSGTEVSRHELHNLIESQLQRGYRAPTANPSNLPPDIA